MISYAESPEEPILRSGTLMVADVPAGLMLTQETVRKILAAYEAKGAALTREETERALA